MLTEQAHAKLNLGLAVTARRGDGFHELDTVFARISLADTLEAGRSETGFNLVTEAAPGLPGAGLLDSGDNLVLIAAREFAAASGSSAGAAFTLKKRIPVAAGLAGGSADAAAALRLLARLYPEAARRVDLPELARRLGSDVPFMLLDLPAARGRGRGERLDPVEVPLLNAVLANPGVAVSAAQAYKWLQNFSRRQPVDKLQAALATGQEPRWQNALQAGVTRELPSVREVLQELRAEGLQGVLMSGSGATCFGLAADQAQANRIASTVAARRPGWWVQSVQVGV